MLRRTKKGSNKEVPTFDQSKTDTPPLKDAHFCRAVEDEYGRVFDLLVESKGYLARHPRPAAAVPAEDRTFVIRQEMRITARLAAAMAWLMMARAVFAGEVQGDATALDIVDPFDLAGCCLDTQGHQDDRLPGRLRDLLKRSYLAYVKIVEMDSKVRGQLQVVH